MCVISDCLLQPNEVHKDEETILSIKVSQVAVAMDLTTDGPAEKMRKFLEELVPEIEKQEEETHKYRVRESKALRTSNLWSMSIQQNPSHLCFRIIMEFQLCFKNLPYVFCWVFFSLEMNVLKWFCCCCDKYFS